MVAPHLAVVGHMEDSVEKLYDFLQYQNLDVRGYIFKTIYWQVEPKILEAVLCNFKILFKPDVFKVLCHMNDP